MSKATQGSFYGTVTPNTNMVDVFKANEIAKNENSYLKFADHMTLVKVGIHTTPGTIISINGSQIKIPESGYFEYGLDFIDVTSLMFETAVEAEILYGY